MNSHYLILQVSIPAVLDIESSSVHTQTVFPQTGSTEPPVTSNNHPNSAFLSHEPSPMQQGFKPRGASEFVDLLDFKSQSPWI